MLGYTAAELLGAAFVSFVYPDDQAVTQAEIERLGAGAPKVSLFHRFRAADGSYHSLRSNAARDPATGLTYIIARDASDEANLANRLKAVIETVVEGMITMDANGVVHRFNPAAERIFGYTAAEIIGKNVTTLMPEPHHPRHTEYISRYLTTGERKVIGIGREVEGARKGGSRFPLELSVSEMIVDGARMFTGITRDFSERKRAEARYEGQARAIEAAQAVVELAPDGTILSANDRFLALMGYRRDEIIGRNHEIFVDPTDVASGEYGEFWGHLARGEFHSGEFARRTKSGETVWLQASYTPVLGLDGRPERGHQVGDRFPVVDHPSAITESQPESQKSCSYKYE